MPDPTINNPGSDIPDPTAFSTADIPDPGSFVPTKNESPSLSGFGKNLVSSGENFASGIGNAVMHPIDTARGILNLVAGTTAKMSGQGNNPAYAEQTATADAFGDMIKSRYGSLDAAKKTAYQDPVGFLADLSTLAGGVGGAAGGAARVADAADMARTADVLGTAGKAASNVAAWTNPVSATAKALGAGVRTGAEAIAPRMIGSSLTAEQQEAIATASRAGVPIDLANATGNQAVQGSKALLRRQPLSAKPLADFSNAQQNALGQWGESLSDEISPSSTGGSASRVSTGTNLADRYAGAIDSTNDFADTAYDKVRALAKKNTKQVQIGTTTSPIAGPGGQPITVPIMQSIEGPTSYVGAKAALQPIVDSIEKTIPANQLQLSPGYSVLKQIVDRPDTVDLDTALQDASAVKKIARGQGEIPQLRSQSQGLAAKATQVMQGAVNDAVSAMGPDAEAALKQGAELTRQKYALRDSLNNLKSEPAQAVDALVQPRDRSIASLTQVARQVPDMMPDVARSTVQGILDRSASRPGGAATQWENLGPQTKQVLFAHDPSLVPKLDNFFRAAKLIGDNPNPSGSATVGSLAATGGLLLHNPAMGAAVLIGSNKLARMLTDPVLVSKLSRGLTTPITTAGANSLFNLLVRASTRIAVGAATVGAMQRRDSYDLSTSPAFNPGMPLPLSSPGAPPQ